MTDEPKPFEERGEADQTGAAVVVDLELSAEESEDVKGGGFRALPSDRRGQIANDTVK